jgi:hypothetical protein
MIRDYPPSTDSQFIPAVWRTVNILFLYLLIFIFSINYESKTFITAYPDYPNDLLS